MAARGLFTLALLSAFATQAGSRTKSGALPPPVSTKAEVTSAVTRLATNGAGAPLPAPPAPAADEPEPEPAAPADPFAVKPDGELSLTVAHSFSRADARERVSQLLAYWAERFGVQSEWHGFRVFLSGKVLGIAVRAIFEVRDANVEAMAENPGSLLAGTARRYVDAKLHKYLHPTYAEP